MPLFRRQFYLAMADKTGRIRRLMLGGRTPKHRLIEEINNFWATNTGSGSAQAERNRTFLTVAQEHGKQKRGKPVRTGVSTGAATGDDTLRYPHAFSQPSTLNSTDILEGAHIKLSHWADGRDPQMPETRMLSRFFESATQDQVEFITKNSKQAPGWDCSP